MLKLSLVIAGVVFAQAAIGQPIKASQRPSAFVDAASLIPGLTADIRCLLTNEAATALAAVARDLAARGLALKIFDCYRPTRAVADFVRWARDLKDQASKAEFYPDVDKRTLFRDGYIASRSGHSRGSTVDLTVARSAGGQVDVELDMGTPFDFFGSKSWTAASNISSKQHANRTLLASAMARRGFRGYAKEWWHFTLRNEPFPNTYFDFPVR
jgi:zinc D-Ala-D-Ala dipeptidase